MLIATGAAACLGLAVTPSESQLRLELFTKLTLVLLEFIFLAERTPPGPNTEESRLAVVATLYSIEQLPNDLNHSIYKSNLNHLKGPVQF